MSGSDNISVSVIRTVKPGCEAAFELALHDFVQRSLALPGQLGVQIIRPASGTGLREYGIIRKFTNHAALDEFRTPPEYLKWNQMATDLTEGAGRTEELDGLESWFTLPGVPLRALPKWKMAIATYLGVLLVIMVLRLTIGVPLQSWNFVLNNVVFNAGVVVVLTWVVMPLITRALHNWLHPKERKIVP